MAILSPPRVDPAPTLTGPKKGPVRGGVRALDPMWWGIIVGAVATIWLTRSAWGSQPLAGTDIAYHLLRADLGIEILSTWRLDGWNPRLFLGTDAFVFYGPGFAWVVAFVRTLGGGLLSTTAAVNVTVLASMAALPAAMAFLARSLRLDRPAAGMVAALTPLVSTPFGVGFAAVFDTGLLVHQVGAMVWAAALGCWLRLPHSADPRWVAGAAGISGFAAITHPVTAQNLALGATVLLALTWRSMPRVPGAVRRLVVAGALAVVVSGIFVIPAFSQRQLSGVPTDWTTPTLLGRLAGIVGGDVLYPLGFGVIAVAAVIHVIRFRRWYPTWLALVCAPLVLLGLGYAIYAVSPAHLVLQQFRNRGLGFIGLLSLMAIGVALSAIAASTDRRRLWSIGVAGAIGVALLAPTLPRLTAEPPPRLVATAEILGEVVPPSGRFAVIGTSQGEWKIPTPALWLAYLSGADTLNGIGLEITSAYRVASVVGSVPDLAPEKAVTQLARLGVTHVVVTDPQVADGLASAAALVWEGEGVTVLSLQTEGRPDPATRLTSPSVVSAEVVSSSRERFEVAFVTDADGPVEIAVAWSPRWYAEIGGNPVALGPTADGMITAAVPAGSHHLVLRNRLDVWHYLGASVSAVGIVIVGSMAWTGRRRRIVGAGVEVGVDTE